VLFTENAVNAAVDLVASDESGAEGPACDNLSTNTDPVSESVRAETETQADRSSNNVEFLQRVTLLNVQNAMRDIRQNSTTLSDLIDSGDVLLCGGIYNVESGEVAFVESEPLE
jgi:carbonic anhydrase